MRSPTARYLDQNLNENNVHKIPLMNYSKGGINETNKLNGAAVNFFEQ